MRSTNPVLSSLSNGQRGQAAAGYQFRESMPDNYGDFGAAPHQAERPMTVDDVVAKTGITLGIIIVGAIVTYGIGLFAPAVAMGLAMVGAIGGFITVMVASFGRKWGSAGATITYAIFESLLVGGITYMFAGWAIAEGTSAASLIGQAVLGTVGVFLGMLFVYKTGAVKVTPKFNRIMTGALIGVLVLMIGNLLLAMFTHSNPLRDGGVLAIIFSLVCIGLAAFSFLQDFDVADKLIRQGAPAKMAWGVALGLAVTLVWLYTEILRLLSYFRN